MDPNTQPQPNAPPPPAPEVGPPPSAQPPIQPGMPADQPSHDFTSQQSPTAPAPEPALHDPKIKVAPSALPALGLGLVIAVLLLALAAYALTR